MKWYLKGSQEWKTENITKNPENPKKKLTQIFIKLQIFTYILPVGFIFLIFTFFNSKYYSVKSVFVMTFFNACAIILGIIGLLLYLLEKYIV